MKVSGIICELNPLHEGHALLFKAARKDCDALVLCMSGDCVQRGEFAVFSKEERTRQALKAGADLVIELPLFGAISSAEGFARAGVKTLNWLGIIDELWFGSECGDEQRIENAARILLEHDTVRSTLENMKQGVSYAAARERALYAKIKDDGIISSPNNILAVEYVKAILLTSSSMKARTIKRQGAAHDEDGDLPSSGAIRKRLENQERVDFFIPPEEACLFSQKRVQRLLTPSLIGLSAQELKNVPGISEGLEYRLAAAIRGGGNWEDIIERAATKRYPRSRIRRAMLCAALGITAEDPKLDAPYIRVLGFNKTGRALLRSSSEKAALPVITKPAAVKALQPDAVRLMEKTAFACAVRNMALYEERYFSCEDEWKKMPVFIE